MKKILVLLISLLCFCGCSTKKTTTTVCKLDTMGMLDSMEIISEGDKVTNLIETVTIKWADFEIETEDDKTLLETTMLDFFEVLEDIDGIKISSKKTDEALNITVKMDIVNGDLDAMKEIGILNFDEDTVSISLEKSIEGLKENGYTCE